MALTAARNICRDELRRRRSHRQVPLPADAAPSAPISADPVEEDEALSALRDCLMQFHERDRSLIVLTVGEGESNRAAARILGWSAADHTITRRLKSIKDKLLRCLKKKGIFGANSP